MSMQLFLSGVILGLLVACCWDIAYCMGRSAVRGGSEKLIGSSSSSKSCSDKLIGTKRSK